MKAFLFALLKSTFGFLINSFLNAFIISGSESQDKNDFKCVIYLTVHQCTVLLTEQCQAKCLAQGHMMIVY